MIITLPREIENLPRGVWKWNILQVSVLTKYHTSSTIDERNRFVTIHLITFIKILYRKIKPIDVNVTQRSWLTAKSLNAQNCLYKSEKKFYNNSIKTITNKHNNCFTCSSLNDFNTVLVPYMRNYDRNVNEFIQHLFRLVDNLDTII
jgi:hypothetical protein